MPGGEEARLRFQQAVYRYSQTTGYNLILKPVQMDFEVFTDAQTVQQMTGSFTQSPPYDYLRKEVRFKGGMGYGIGISLQQARENAYEAAGLSARRVSEGEFRSYLINSQNNIILLKNRSSQKERPCPSAISSDYVEQVATRCRLGGSLRTANKILSHLQEGDAAEIVGQKRLGQKGRPVNIYRLKLEEIK